MFNPLSHLSCLLGGGGGSLLGGAGFPLNLISQR
jgi:hypothetical protein